MLEFEGLDQPARWPGEQSGITLGHGYDLGYSTPAQFAMDWRPHLTAGTISRLTKAIGVRGPRAKGLTSEFRDITVTRSQADEVFARVTIPTWERLTMVAFEGSEKLPADAFGALVSLCFNRGTGMDGDRRLEMRQIREAIDEWTSGEERDLQNLLGNIAGLIRAMKRLWVGKGVDGLLRRRDAEAALVESAAGSGQAAAIVARLGLDRSDFSTGEK